MTFEAVAQDYDISFESDYGKVTTKNIRRRMPFKLNSRTDYPFFDNVVELINWRVVQLHNNVCGMYDSELCTDQPTDAEICVRATYTTFPNMAMSEHATVMKVFTSRGFVVNCYVGAPVNVFCHKCYKRKKLCCDHRPTDAYYSIVWSYD